MTIKFFGLIPRRAGMSTAEFHDHYRHPHGTLGLALPTIKRYVQSHQIHTELLDESQSRFEAVAEDWFDTVEDAVGLSSDPHYLEHIQPDEPLFVDLDNLKWLNTREQFIADRDGDLAGVAGGGHGGEVRAGEDVDVRPADHDHARGRSGGDGLGHRVRIVTGRPPADLRPPWTARSVRGSDESAHQVCGRLPAQALGKKPPIIRVRAELRTLGAVRGAPHGPE